MKATHIRVTALSHSYENFNYRTPIKFGGVALDRVTLLNVECGVSAPDGRTARGFGSMPLGNVWSFPSRVLNYEATLNAMKMLARRIQEIQLGCDLWGHPISRAHQLEAQCEQAAAVVTRELHLAEPIPRLCTMVVASAFDAAVHDAYGKLHKRNCYHTYGPAFLDYDLGHFLGAEFRGETLDQYISREPQPRLPLYHLIGALDPLTASDVKQALNDGLPQTLPEWIHFDGLTHLKIKLNGDDLGWDLDRVLAVDRVAVETQRQRGVSHWCYSLDFNERCANVAYLLEFLRKLRERAPDGFERIAYVEQPTARDLKADRGNVMHEAAKLRPVVIDESLVDLESLRLAREMGYTGAALKACKGQSQSLLLAAAARKYGMFLCVQDLSCPGASLIHSAGLAAHVPGVSAIESNARQYLPDANRPWEERFPGIFRITDGTMATSCLTGLGLGAVSEYNPVSPCPPVLRGTGGEGLMGQSLGRPKESSLMRRRMYGPFFGALVLLGGLLPALTLGADEPRLHKSDLFEAGKGGHKLYRIPGIVVTAKGSILAYCEARKHSGFDWDDIKILLRRSSDGGKTWSEPKSLPRPEGKFERNPAAVAKKLAKEGEITFNNPVAIVDRGGLVHFLYCIDYGRCFYLRSEDDGVTFSKPVEITRTFEQFHKDYPWRVFGTGPAHGIQLKNGRLLVTVWLSKGTGNNAHHPTVVATIYSDDAGKTWQCGDIAANETDPLLDPSETVLVQLADGRVLLNMRNDSKQHRRAVAFSPDGATKWTKPVFDEQLKEPICMASLCRLSEKGKSDRNRLLFTNPDNLDSGDRKAEPARMHTRKNLTVKLSYDEGRTWPVSRVLDAGTSGYSDLAVGPDGTIYCLYERGSTDGKDHFATRTLTLARFNLEWLTEGKDRLEKPVTNDPK